MRNYCKNREGDLIMMSDLVIGWGNEIIQDECKKDKTKKTNSLFSYFDFWMLQRKLKKLDYRDTISRDKDVMNGKVVFKGTRIPVKVVYDFFVEKHNNETFNPNTFICEVKDEYPSLKDKKDKIVIKGLMYYIGNKPIFTLFK